MEWKGKVINKVDEKVKTLSIEISSKLHKSVLQQNMSLNALNDVHNHFVVTQVDEANESVVFICQQFYVLQNWHCVKSVQIGVFYGPNTGK